MAFRKSAFSNLVLLVLLASAARGAQVRFSYEPAVKSPAQVSVAGEFNNWNADASLMTDADGDGLFETTLEIAPGRYEYKFVVDGSWHEDPFAAEQVPDPYGGKNSVLVVPDGAAKIDAGRASASSGKGDAAEREKPAANKTLSGDEVTVLFRFTPPVPNARLVTVAGEWNDWNMGADYLSDADGDGVFEGEVLLSPGRYEYKFVADGAWFTDPLAAEQVANDQGSENSVIEVTGDPGSLLDASKGEIAAKRYVIGAPVGDGTAGAGTDLREVTFRFRPKGGAKEVFLAGTFNEWSTTAQPMDGPDEEGAFAVRLPLTPGEYLYKFVADGNWFADPENNRSVDDGFGGQNSVLNVDDSFPSVAIARGDGAIRGDGLSFSGTLLLTRSSETTVVATVKAFRGDVDSVTMTFTPEEGKPRTITLASAGEDGQFTYERGEFEAPGEGTVRVLYHDGATVLALGEEGLVDPDDGEMPIDPESIPLFTLPDWVADGVLYQIFPERFRNGDRENDPDFSESYYNGLTELPPGGKTNGEYFHLVTDWDDIAGLTRSPYRTDGKPDYYSFYGGDLDGVIEKLDYLQDLGVTILYFNPLHQAQSNHKYDAVNYMRVDPHFGGDEAFRRLAGEAHRRGMRIVIDGVFNHTGMYHWAFLDTKEKGEKSPYWTWYDWRKWPLPEQMAPDGNWSDYYACWWGFGSLPDLNYDLSRPDETESSIDDIDDAKPNRELVDHILEVARHWMKDLDADGYRLDVPNEVPPWFWKLFREAVRESRVDGGFVWAELWGNAAGDLGRNRFDATMNYKYFLEPVLSFIGKGSTDAKTFDAQLAAGRFSYPRTAVLGSMNLIGSHDTERFLTRAGRDTRRLELAATFAATYIGVPTIYYGDEIAMEGGKDPDCRRPFPWDELGDPGRKKVHDLYRAVLAIRKEHAALRRGDFHTLLAEEKVYAYTRSLGNDHIAVILNAGAGAVEVQLDRSALPFDALAAKGLLSGGSYDFSSGDGGSISVALEPYGAAILEITE